MTLNVHTDASDRPWLEYILEEFRRIQGADFTVSVSTQQNDTRTLTSPQHEGVSVSLYRSALASIPTRVIKAEGIAYFDGTLSQNKTLDEPLDLLWNAFIFLSRKEEWEAEQKGNLLNSYLGKHPREDKSTFDLPIVNLLFDRFEALIRARFPSLPWKDSNKPVVELSHDLDYITKTFQLRGKQTAFNSFNSLKAIAKGGFFPQVGKTFRFLFSNPSYWCFDYWEQFEKQVEARSTFYIYTRHGSRNFKAWLIDPSYDVTSNKKLQGTLKNLHQEGFTLGLHGSYRSALEHDRLAAEKSALEAALDLPVTKTRQHWLHFQEAVTPRIHEALFDYDSTVGWNSTMGYRAGCASLYRPYDHANQRAFDYFEIPQVVMDSHIYDYGAGQSEALISKGIGILEDLANRRNAHVAISWHPRTCSSDYNWQPAYEALVKTAARHEYL